jgi:general stress protein CsbA
MSSFILEIVFFISIGVLVFLFVNKLPYVSDVVRVEATGGSPRKGIFHSEWIEKLDRKFIDLLSKWLRKAKLVVMRLDNYVTKHIESIKHKQGNDNNQQNILKDLENDTKEEGDRKDRETDDK